MKYADRERILEKVSYESRLGFVAFCVQRCLDEARRHPQAREELEQLPLLTEGLDLLWARAEEGSEPDPKRLEAVLKHLSGYETSAQDGENTVYRHDVSLVKAAGELRGGIHLMKTPDDADGDQVASALEGPVQAIGLMYADGATARASELGVIDAALKKLEKLGAKPFSRRVFEGIPDWKRGALSSKYAERRLTGTDVNQDD
jgi:hypothetical protein